MVEDEGIVVPMAKTTTPPEKKYRFTIYIRGMREQHLYAKERTFHNVRKRAIKALTEWKPGGGSLWPERVEVQEQVTGGFARYASWKLTDTILYDSLGDSDKEWMKREQRHADAKRDVAQAEASLSQPVVRKGAIGIMPRWRHDELRMIALTAAITRYGDAEQAVPAEWHDELNELIARCTTKCKTCAQPLVLCPHFDEKSQAHQDWAHAVNAADAEGE